MSADESLEQLRVSEERYRLLAESADDVIWTMSVDGAITYVSPAVERMRGITPAEAMVQPLEKIHPPESMAISQGYFVRLFEAIAQGRLPEPFRCELEYYRKDGTTVWTEVHVIPHVTTGGSLVEILGVTRDISDRKRNEDHLATRAQHAALVQRFSQGVAHDFGNIANVIDGYARLLAVDPSAKVIERAAEGLAGAAARALAVTRRIRTIAEIQQVQNAPIDIAAVVRGYAATLRAVVTPGIHLSVDVPSVAIGVANAAQLESVLDNLAQNAATAMQGSGNLSVSVGSARRSHGPVVELRVADDGPGIPARIRERLFQPFVTSKPTDGGGLGLYLIQEYMYSCGGRITADSSAAGTTFCLEFPGA